MGCGTSKSSVQQKSLLPSADELNGRQPPQENIQNQTTNISDNNSDNNQDNSVKMFSISQQKNLDDLKKDLPDENEKNKDKIIEDENHKTKDVEMSTNEKDAKIEDNEKIETKSVEPQKKVPEKLTPAQIAELHAKKIAKLKEKIPVLMGQAIHDEEGVLCKFFRTEVLSIAQLYYSLKGANRKENSLYKTEMADVMCQTNFVDFICKFIMDTTKEKKYIDDEGKTVVKYFNPLKVSLSLLLNLSDASSAFAERLCVVPGFLDSIKTSLEAMREAHFKIEGTAVTDEDKLIKNLLGITHNMAMVSACESHLRCHDYTSMLLQWLDSRLSMCRLSSITALADIVDEKESGLLQTKNSGIKYLIKIFGKSLKNETHKELGWSAWELARSVGRLARNDANKKLLVEQGALPLLVELSKSDDPDEEEVALESLWVLAFDEDNKTVVLEEEGLMDMVLDKYRKADNKKIRKNCQGILWNLRDLLSKSDKYSVIAREFTTTPKSSEDKKFKGHVMISYQWANQEVLKRVRDSLKQLGYPVWMDIDNMGGSTLQAMAEAIENASTVLVCMSQKYKDSPNCRAEAEYAFSKRKEIVPLLMEQGYRPDGWLGMILGAKLFFDFSGKYTYESRIDGLKKEIAQRLAGSERAIAGDEVDSGSKPIVAERAPVTFSAPPIGGPFLDAVKKWKKEDVKKWLKKHNLTGTSLENLTGKEIAFMKQVRYEAPEFFFRTVETKLGLSGLLDIVNFTEAMEDLTTK